MGMIRKAALIAAMMSSMNPASIGNDAQVVQTERYTQICGEVTEQADITEDVIDLEDLGITLDR